MDYGGFRRSGSVEGVPTDEGLRGYMQWLTGQAIAPFQASWEGLRNHPFVNDEDYYRSIDQRVNPIPTPDQYTPLGKQLGVETAQNPPPIPMGPTEMDPLHMQILLQQLDPEGADLPLLPRSGFPMPSGNLGDY